jgi:hypothetical protein
VALDRSVFMRALHDINCRAGAPVVRSLRRKTRKKPEPCGSGWSRSRIRDREEAWAFLPQQE